MKYKTKGGVSPQGKAKVYFACHPADIRFLDRICRDIWKHRDASVWYKEDNDAVMDEEELLLMQVMLIPVTSKLLEAPDCQAFKDFEFFCKNNLPVLPIMMERGLEDLYNEKFHNIQFLNASSTDPTELPFEEKMRYTLDTLLPNEEVIARVRKAFVAYIFLSYRKKDRQKAQELMQMIHRVPEYRDVAIWYDEFIVGSENFNDSIQRALKKCDFFTLMVTPNLINENNYVKEQEFPMAMQENKEILPIEMVSTNREELCQQFEGIPDIIDGADEEFEVYLREKYKKLAFVRKDGHPEHDYLMGLAYLNGIDVETNFEMAEKLIRAAADAGVVEAMGELVNMLYFGKGIACNREEAIRVQKQKVAVASIMEDGLTLIEELDRLGNMYMELRKTKEATETYEELRNKANDAFDQAHSDKEEYALALRISDSWIKTGDLLDINCECRKALSAYEEAMQFCQLVFGTKSERAAYILQTGNIKSGDILFRTGEVESALSKYKSAEAVANLLMEMNDNEENRRRLCKSKVQLASCCIKLEQYEAAEEYLKSGLEMAEKLAGEIESVEDIHICILYYDGWGDWYKARGEWDCAATYYNKSNVLRQKQLEDENTIECKLNMIDGYANMSELLHDKESYSESEDYCKKGLELCTSLDEKTSEPGFQYAFIHLLLCLGDARYAQGDKTEALQNYQEGINRIENFLHRNKDMELLYTAGEYYIKSARLERESGNPDASCEQYWKGIFLTRAIEKDGKVSITNLRKQYDVEMRALEGEFIKQYGRGYFNACLSRVPYYAKDSEGAENRRCYGVKYLGDQEAITPEVLRYAAGIIRLITLWEVDALWKRRDIKLMKAHVNCYTRLAKVEELFGFMNAAEKDYEKAIHFSEEDGSTEMLITLITSCEKIIQFEKHNDNFDVIPKYMDKIHVAAERRAAEAPSEKTLVPLARWYNQLAQQEKDDTKALEYYQKAVDIANSFWNHARGVDKSPLLEEWYISLDNFEKENGIIELRVGQNNATANNLLMRWYATIDSEKKERLQTDLDRYLSQDKAGQLICAICPGFSELLRRKDKAEEAEKIMELKEFVAGELEKEEEYFRHWMSLLQMTYLLKESAKQS